jgi:predicted Zn-dependent protease
MRRLLILFAVVAICVAGITIAVRRKSQARVGPEALLNLIGNVEREATRLPARVTRISDEEEIAAGNEIAQRRMDNLGTDDLAVERYIQQVGNKLALRSRRPLPYRFHYIPDPSLVNAFALPGGHVFIGAGMLYLMDSEDQLAAVLGHEIEHIDQRHCVERLQVEATLRKLHLGIAGELAQLPIQLFQAGYSKEQELEADREGTRVAVAAGYSATGAVRMFEAFERQPDSPRRPRPRTPQEEAAGIAVQTISDYFRSHPWPEERRAQIQRMIDADRSIEHRERPLQAQIVSKTASAP